jgi:hypothetical protein
MPGFCGGISYGDCRDLYTLLKEGIDSQTKPILAYIARNDFQGLLEFAVQHGYDELNDGYFSKCHFCVHLRKHLVTIGSFKELSPPQFYEHVDKV